MGEIGWTVGGLVVAAWLMSLSAFDIRHRRLPNVLTLPGAAIILAVAAMCGAGLPAATGAAALFLSYAAVHLAAPGALGAGDVKLAIGVGALTGAFGIETWLLCAFGASTLTGVLGLGQLLRGTRSSVPHGPSMCLSSAVAVLVFAGRLPVG